MKPKFYFLAGRLRGPQIMLYMVYLSSTKKAIEAGCILKYLDNIRSPFVCVTCARFEIRNVVGWTGPFWCLAHQGV